MRQKTKQGDFSGLYCSSMQYEDYNYTRTIVQRIVQPYMQLMCAVSEQKGKWYGRASGLNPKPYPWTNLKSKTKNRAFPLLPLQSHSWSQCYCLSPCRPMGEKPSTFYGTPHHFSPPSLSLLSQSKYDIKGNLAVSSSINILFQVMREPAPITGKKREKRV